MKTEEVYEIIKGYLIDTFEIPVEKIFPDSNLFEDLELDSIDALDMIALLESEIDIDVNEEELKKIITIQNVVDYIINNLAGK